jgi:hypothetical protein
MTSNDLTRLNTVRDLLELKRPIQEVLYQLKNINWDFDGDGVELTTSHLKNALLLYLDGILSASEIEAWANAVECRDDIYFESNSNGRIDDVLHELANPLLTYRLDPLRARTLIDVLNDPHHE